MKPGFYEQAFIEMRQLLKAPESWIKGSYAKTGEFGYEAEPESKEATCFCLLGAARKVASSDKALFCDVYFAIRQMVRLFHVESVRSTAPIPDFNDAPKTTHADILEFLGVAIINCREAGV